MNRKDIDERSAALIAQVGKALAENLGSVSSSLGASMATQIAALRGDDALLELLQASVESNLETIAHFLRYDLPIAPISTPFAAREYARRLAQRGISSTALVRAYRLGHWQLVDWAYEQITSREDDEAVVLRTFHNLVELTFGYIDGMSEAVVSEYETEQVRWLSNRNTMRTALIEELVRGGVSDTASAEKILGYRLSGHHIGVVLWTTGSTSSEVDLPVLERLLTVIANIMSAGGAPLFQSRDHGLVWGWVPVRDADTQLVFGAIERAASAAGPNVMAAFGRSSAGAAGFRITHLEAVQAREVALTGRSRDRVVTFDDPQVRTASLLVHDLEGTRRRVDSALGALARQGESAERLRETLLVFLACGASYTVAAEQLHLHKNTVKYRVDKALEERGRPLADDRLELELALIACRWLGAQALSRKR